MPFRILSGASESGRCRFSPFPNGSLSKITIMAESEDEKIVDENDVEDQNDEEEEEVADDTPPVRRNVGFFVGRRQGIKEGKKLAEKEEEGDEPELTDNARKAIRSELSPMVSALKKQADDLDVQSHLSQHPDDAKYEKAIRRRMEAWPDVPVSEIAKTVKFGRPEPEAKERKEAAVTKAKGSALRGSSSRAEEPKLPSTQAEFKDIYARVKRGEKFDLTQYGS